ncbi:MAG: MBL fold metallo-hydrolase [bacterium]
MKIKFWGVRGSIPVPGIATMRYGGNTSCVQVLPSDETILIVDAGTGIRKLGKQLMQGVCGDGKGDIHLLISHTHWDHIQGLPFFAPSYREGNHITVYARERDDTHLDLVLKSATRDPYFPVPFDAVQAEASFRELKEGDTFRIGTCDVACCRLNHPWIALGYRVEEAGRAFMYISDTAPFTELLLEHDYIAAPPSPGDTPPPEEAGKLVHMQEELIRLCRGCSLIVFDTMFTGEEYLQRPHWGHSSPAHAVEIARQAGVGRLVLFHHAPNRTDEQVDSLLAAVQASAPDLEITAAAEGAELEI